MGRLVALKNTGTVLMRGALAATVLIGTTSGTGGGTTADGLAASIASRKLDLVQLLRGLGRIFAS